MFYVSTITNSRFRVYISRATSQPPRSQTPAMDVQSILKLLLLAVGILFNQLVNTPPNLPPRPEERAKYGAGTLETGSFTLVRAVALLKVRSMQHRWSEDY